MLLSIVGRERGAYILPNIKGLLSRVGREYESVYAGWMVHVDGGRTTCNLLRVTSPII